MENWMVLKTPSRPSHSVMVKSHPVDVCPFCVLIPLMARSMFSVDSLWAAFSSLSFPLISTICFPWHNLNLAFFILIDTEMEASFCLSSSQWSFISPLNQLFSDLAGVTDLAMRSQKLKHLKYVVQILHPSWVWWGEVQDCNQLARVLRSLAIGRVLQLWSAVWSAQRWWGKDGEGDGELHPHFCCHQRYGTWERPTNPAHWVLQSLFRAEQKAMGLTWIKSG